MWEAPGLRFTLEDKETAMLTSNCGLPCCLTVSRNDMHTETSGKAYSDVRFYFSENCLWKGRTCEGNYNWQRLSNSSKRNSYFQFNWFRKNYSFLVSHPTCAVLSWQSLKYQWCLKKKKWLLCKGLKINYLFKILILYRLYASGKLLHLLILSACGITRSMWRSQDNL